MRHLHDAPQVRPRGLFVGLATLDLIQRVDALPGPDTKATATWQHLAAGGPALNAAVTFAALGGHATLVTRIGAGPVASLVTDDLRRHQVRVVDLAAAGYAVSVSAIAVEAGTGARQVISTDAGQAVPPSREALGALGALEDAGPDVVLLDGHHADLAGAVLDGLDPGAGNPVAGHPGAGIPVVLDAGRWKPPMAELMPRCTHVVCSAEFRLDGTLGGEELFEALLARGARLAATTHGARPIRWRTASERGEVPVPQVEAVDTLGAGDALHGAHAWAVATGADTPADLRFAATVAARSATVRGTRAWLPDLLPDLWPDPAAALTRGIR